MNPYWNKNFCEFFIVLFQRMIGKIPLPELASDELQILILVGICFSTTLIGVFLSLKKMTMLANSLSHTILVGIAITCISAMIFKGDLVIDLQTLLIASVISAAATSLLTEALTRITHLQEDASIGISFSSLFAVGIILVTTFTRSMHIGTEAIMGNLDALHPQDLLITAFAVLLNGIIVVLMYRQFTITAFDPLFASTSGISCTIYNNILLLACSISIVAAFRAVGVILVLAFLVTPTLIARLWTNQIKFIILLAILIGVCSAVIGVAGSRHVLSVWGIPLSTSSFVASLLGFFYLASLVLKNQIRKRIDFKQQDSFNPRR